MKHNRHHARDGTILICVLACLVIVTAVIGSTTQVALRARRTARVQLQLRQTELLCEAGVLRAAQQLRKSASYAGEHWRPKLMRAADTDADADADADADSQAEQNSDSAALAEASVDIRVLENEDASSRDVEVIARLDSPATSAGPVQRSHRFTLKIPATSSSEQ